MTEESFQMSHVRYEVFFTNTIRPRGVGSESLEFEDKLLYDIRESQVVLPLSLAIDGFRRICLCLLVP